MASSKTMRASISHMANSLVLRNCMLWKTDRCPACRAVMMCIDAMHLSIIEHNVNMEDAEHSKIIHSINPIGTLPVFKNRSLILSDSHAITSYLAYKSYSWTSNKLLPKEPRQRMRLIEHIFYNSSVLNPLYMEITKPLRLKKKISLTFGQVERVESSYLDVDNMLEKNPYFGGRSPSLGDILLCAYISTLDLIVPVCRYRWPDLSEWLCRMSGEKFYKSANQKGLEDFAAQIGKESVTPSDLADWQADSGIPPKPALLSGLRRPEVLGVLGSWRSLDCPRPEIIRMTSNMSPLNLDLFRLKMRQDFLNR